MKPPIERPWKGEYISYGCPEEGCCFDSLDLDDVREHWELKHGPTVRQSPILGPTGEPVYVEERRIEEALEVETDEQAEAEAEAMEAEQPELVYGLRGALKSAWGQRPRPGKGD